jgi:hypothetical protein
MLLATHKILKRVWLVTSSLMRVGELTYRRRKVRPREGGLSEMLKWRK